MLLYDEWIKECHRFLERSEGKLIHPVSNKNWPDAGEHQLILRKEMAYELGGDTYPAISGFGLTSSSQWFENDEIWLYGADLPKITQNTPYARLAFILVEDEGFFDDQQTYSSIRKIEYTRYHVHPQGFMTRISVASEREPVRISRSALDQGLDFAKVGQRYLDHYHNDLKVKAVKLVFITLPDFPYSELDRLAHKAQQITLTLDHIYKNLNMDCSSCHLKEICDEVEGIRELHFKHDRSDSSIQLNDTK